MIDGNIEITTATKKEETLTGNISLESAIEFEKMLKNEINKRLVQYETDYDYLTGMMSGTWPGQAAGGGWNKWQNLPLYLKTDPQYFALMSARYEAAAEAAILIQHHENGSPNHVLGMKLQQYADFLDGKITNYEARQKELSLVNEDNMLSLSKKIDVGQRVFGIEHGKVVQGIVKTKTLCDAFTVKGGFSGEFTPADVGKNIFLTSKEAETVLKPPAFDKQLQIS